MPMPVIDIGMSIDIYIDIASAPIPGPPAPAPERSYSDTNSKPERTPGKIWTPKGKVSEWSISRPPPVSVNLRRVIIRHIDLFRIGRLNLDIITLNNYLLLFGRFEIT